MVIFFDPCWVLCCIKQCRPPAFEAVLVVREIKIWEQDYLHSFSVPLPAQVTWCWEGYGNLNIFECRKTWGQSSCITEASFWQFTGSFFWDSRDLDKINYQTDLLHKSFNSRFAYPRDPLLDGHNSLLLFVGCSLSLTALIKISLTSLKQAITEFLLWSEVAY